MRRSTLLGEGYFIMRSGIVLTGSHKTTEVKGLNRVTIPHPQDKRAERNREENEVNPALQSPCRRRDRHGRRNMKEGRETVGRIVNRYQSGV